MNTTQDIGETRASTPFISEMGSSPNQPSQSGQEEAAQSTPETEPTQTSTNELKSNSKPSESSENFGIKRTRKRIQPPRARGTKFGKHHSDDLIVEAIERAERDKPSIPPETVFLCTTDNSMMPNMQEVLESIHPAGTGPADELPMHSYFRNPEVMRKIRSQELIETPMCREATQEDWDEAIAQIPEEWQDIPPDTSLDYYQKHHMTLERREIEARNREVSKRTYDYNHLELRLAELQRLDASGFRGETMTEQEQDKIVVLATAENLLEKNLREKRKAYVKGNKKSKVNSPKFAEESLKGPIESPQKPKELKGERYSADFDPEEEVVVANSKKRQSKKRTFIETSKSAGESSKKHKRDPTRARPASAVEEVKRLAQNDPKDDAEEEPVDG